MPVASALHRAHAPSLTDPEFDRSLQRIHGSRLAAPVALGEIPITAARKARLVIEDIVAMLDERQHALRRAHPDRRSKRPSCDGSAVIIKLQCDADDIEPGPGEERGRDEEIHPTDIATTTR